MITLLEMKLNKKRKMCIDAKIIECLFLDDEFLASSLSHKKINHSRYPKTDQWCEEESFNLAFALAGFDPGDISVYVENDFLFVETSKKNSDKINSDHGFIHRGIAKRSFRKSYFLDNSLDIDNVKAQMKNGLLTITIPFSEEKKERVNVEVSCE